LVLDDVTLRRGGHDVLVHASARAGAGLVLLEGPNGSGKSSLLAAIAGVLPVTRGRIAIAGHDLERDDVAARRQLGWLPQRSDAFLQLSPQQGLGFVAGVRGVALAPALSQLSALLGPAAGIAIGSARATLSAGMRRKVSLVAATLGEPTLLLLDEPLDALDDAGATATVAIVDAWIALGRTVVCAMHQPTATWTQRAAARWQLEGRAVHPWAGTVA
jgi:ABC-type multidrug transport system ATPase subunit